MNYLKKICEHQHKLDTRIESERTIDRFFNDEMLGLTIAIDDELAEVRKGLNWKWWKNPKYLDIEYLKEEWIDILHFVISGFNKLGMDEKDIYHAYIAKNSENHLRQDGMVEGREDYKVEV